MERVVSGDVPDAVDVYWRPGCGFCSRLLRVFDQSGVRVRLHNIWDDGEARSFVQRHNRGNETVPTVAVGRDVVTNPSPKDFVEQLRREHPGLVAAAQGTDHPGLVERIRGRVSPGD
jgi:mycoredoxin